MCTHPRLLLPIALFIGGMGLIGAAVASGEADVSLVVIFPVFSGAGGVFLLGVSLVVLSLLIGFAFMAMGQLEIAEYQRQVGGDVVRPDGPRGGEAKVGGVVLIGPVPIAFGSSMKTAIIMMVVGIALAIVALAVILAIFD